MASPDRWFAFRHAGARSRSPPKKDDNEDIQRVDSAKEGLNVDDDAVYRNVKARHEQRSASTINTLLAIKSHRKRRRIVSHRIRRLKCLITFLFCIAFILSFPYCYILYQIERNASKDRITLGVDFVYRHVHGTAMFEIGVSVVLLFFSCLRVIWPKKETVYYISHVCYLFVIIHYAILIPLDTRNFWKSLSRLEEYMRDKMQTGRCYKLPVQTAVKSKFETISRVRDIQGCVIEKKNLKLSSIRFEVQKECDGDKTWFATARNLVEASKIPNSTDAEDLAMDLDWIKANGSYEIYSVEWVNSQRKHKCCGIDSRKDWYQTSKVDMYKTKEALAEMESWFIYPDSCCKPLNQSDPHACTSKYTHGGTCTSHEQLTVITYSLSTLVTLVACGIFNFTIFILLVRLRRMVERFRPDLLELG